MGGQIANTEMAAAWDGDEGEEWARDWERYDKGAAAHHRTLLEAADLSPGEQVLDIGCGNGQVTRDAARATGDGAALGVDLSSRMLERARNLATDEGVANAAFERADAQVHPFEPASYDVVLSRFGAMFFNDAAAAFGNIGLAMKPGGRLVMVAWRGLADNEWLQCILTALSGGRPLPAPPPGAPGPFGLADADFTRATLDVAGFEAVDLIAVDGPFWAGTDADDAFAFLSGIGVARGMLQDADEPQRAQALDALRATLADHETKDGVVFGSGVWLISARRPA